MYVIGAIKLFFSFDPEYLVCDRCGWRKATHLKETTRDGGARVNIKNLCKNCYVVLDR